MPLVTKYFRENCLEANNKETSDLKHVRKLQTTDILNQKKFQRFTNNQFAERSFSVKSVIDAANPIQCY